MAYQVGGDDHEPLGGLVDPLDPEPLVQRRAQRAVSAVERADQPAGLNDNATQLALAEGLGGGGAQAGAFGLGGRDDGGGLVDPARDDRRVGAGVQGGAVLGELPLAGGEGLLCGVELGGDGVGVVAGGLQRGEGLVDVFGIEQVGEPAVQMGEQVGLAQVDRPRMGEVQAGGGAVFGRVRAAVVGLGVDPVALQPPGADPAAQPPAHHVQPMGGRGLVGLVPPRARVDGGLDLVEGLLGDQGLVGGLLGPDPGIPLVPAHPAHIAGGDVVDVEQDLVAALLVPDLVAGVAGVEQDRADGVLGPADALAVWVATGVVPGGRADLVGIEPLGNRQVPSALEELRIDPRDDRRGGGVGLQATQAHAEAGLGRVGMRSGVGEAVAVGRPAAEIAALDGGLRLHGGADAGLDAHALALGLAAEQRHRQVVRFGAGVDRAADLGNPELDAKVLEDREGEGELVAVERALGLADHHRLEAACGVAEDGEQLGGFGAALPGQRAGVADVEVFGHDHPAHGLDELPSTRKLPLVGGLRILLVLGGDPAVEGNQKLLDPIVGHPAALSHGVGHLGGESTGSKASREASAGVSGWVAFSRMRSSTLAASGDSLGGACGSRTVSAGSLAAVAVSAGRVVDAAWPDPLAVAGHL